VAQPGTLVARRTDVDDVTVAGFRLGEHAAVRAVYERYAGPVRSVAMRMLGDYHLAEDVVQLTFLKAWRASSTMDDSRAMAPWLFSIARRVAIDLYRSNRRLVFGEVEPPAIPPASFDQVWTAWQVGVAVRALPVAERDVVAAQHFLGLTHDQIAVRLGIPLGTVKSRSHRAHRRLADALRLLAHR
jgi:RNA polymerase sigma factor (sigma-70 family)